MTGKEKCEVLKKVRNEIADQNGIDYHTSECTFKGECKGTCPKCEAELSFLTGEIKKLKNSGKRIAVAGIAAAIVATSVSGCAPHKNNDAAEPSTENIEVTEELGDIAYVPESEFDGEAVYLPELDDPTGDVEYIPDIIGEVAYTPDDAVCPPAENDK